MLIIASGRARFSITFCHSHYMKAMKTLEITVCLKSNRHLLKPQQSWAISTHWPPHRLHHIHFFQTGKSHHVPDTVTCTKNSTPVWIHLSAPWIRKVKNPSAIKPEGSLGWADVQNRPWFLLHSFPCKDVSKCFLCCVLVCSPLFWRSQNENILELFPLPDKGL